jgi:hypothetical protein
MNKEIFEIIKRIKWYQYLVYERDKKLCRDRIKELINKGSDNG